MGDLHETEQDSDVDIETESLLPTTQHNQRSHSFSMYQHISTTYTCHNILRIKWLNRSFSHAVTKARD